MADNIPGTLMDVTGTLRQLVPDAEQMVDGETQIPSRPLSPLVRVAEDEKRVAPMPVSPRPPLPSEEVIAQQTAYQNLYGGPVMKWNRYSGSDKDWVEVVRWDVPIGYTGDLHELSLQSDNDEKTRYRIHLANVNQDLETDRQFSTPCTFPWRQTVIPGGYSCWVEVRTTDGTAINVDVSLTGTVR